MKTAFLIADRWSKHCSEFWTIQNKNIYELLAAGQHVICSPLVWEQSNQEVSVCCSVPFHVSNKVAQLLQLLANWSWLINLLSTLVKSFDFRLACASSVLQFKVWLCQLLWHCDTAHATWTKTRDFSPESSAWLTETQSLTLERARTARKNSLFTGINLGQD